MTTGGPVRLFLSYAHEDSKWCEAVLNHLGWLRHSGRVEAFHDRALKPGERWDDRIKAELATSEIVIGLVSPHFMGSRYCCLDELQPAIDRQDRGEADLVPIVCDHVELGPLRPHQCLPQDDNNDLKPLCDWPNPNLPLARCAAKVRALVEARRPPGSLAADPPPPSPSPAPSLLPSRGRFLGRHTDLEQLCSWILDEARQPIALLGPGGIGKSKLALAALHDFAIATRFEDRRRFVQLEEVRDGPGIHRAVAQALGVDAGAQATSAIAAMLRQQATLLVLDNAETPWQADLVGAEQAFAWLAELPGARLVASLRGFELPGVTDWRPILVEPLPSDQARELFIAIAGTRYSDDPRLPTLIARLDGLPLAIELVAHRALTEPDAGTVLQRWDEEKSAFLRRGDGGRKDLDLAVSISLSLASPRMSAPGRRLFAVLGRLPHGLARADLAAIMPKTGPQAASALARTGLIHAYALRVRLLAPVREFAAEQDLPEPEAAMLERHFNTLAAALPFVGKPISNSPAATRAREELSNIESVLSTIQTAMAPADLHDRGWRWIQIGDTRLASGNVVLAAAAYEAAHEYLETAAKSAPYNPYWQHGLAASWMKVGEIQETKGNLLGAHDAYLSAKNIAEQLTKADPNNAEWHRGLSVCWNKLGDIRLLQGDRDAALEAYTADKEIAERLVAAEPTNVQWQFDLGISLERIGTFLLAQGEVERARTAYRIRHDTIVRLHRADPENSVWQRDLATSWMKLGDTQEAMADYVGANAAYESSLLLCEKLSIMDPVNADVKNALALC